MSDEYLVWSHEHGAWWRPDGEGYTIHVPAAGRYTRNQAISICRDARNGWSDSRPPSEIPVRLDDVMACGA